ncbi:NUDIX hydrolase [Candidatus Woesearchaeota archaeon]|nr:NUDIX hydrolase [Candidatus Woesearchaeota archaeon]
MKMLEAVLLILEKDEKVLFGRRAKTKESLPERWSLPSEKIKPGEDLVGAVRRCAEHELGLTKLSNITLYDKKEVHKEGEHKILYFFKANYEGTPTPLAEDELTELEYHSFKDFFAKYKDKEIGHGLQYLRKSMGFLLVLAVAVTNYILP